MTASQVPTTGASGDSDSSDAFIPDEADESDESYSDGKAEKETAVNGARDKAFAPKTKKRKKTSATGKRRPVVESETEEIDLTDEFDDKQNILTGVYFMPWPPEWQKKVTGLTTAAQRAVVEGKLSPADAATLNAHRQVYTPCFV